MSYWKSLITGFICMTIGVGGGVSASAAEVKLTAGFFNTSQKSLFRLVFNKFVDELNKEGKGQISIAKITDTSAIPRGQMAKALKDGILDIIAIPPSTMDKLVPGMGGLSVSRITTQKMRTNGTFDLVNEFSAKNANAKLISLYANDMPFYIYTNKAIRSVAEFKGIRIRATNTNREFFKALETQPLKVGRGEIYTAMERGVIDGYANINNGLYASSWAEVVKFRVGPGFFAPNIAVFMNLKKYKSLNDKQRAILDAAGIFVEGEPTAWATMEDEKFAARAVKEKGMEIIKFNDADTAKFLDLAYGAQWDAIEKKAPKFGPLLREKIAK